MTVIRLTSSLSSGLPRHDSDRPGFELRPKAVLHIQPQAPLPLLLVKAVALEAVVGQDRPDIAAEIDLPFLGEKEASSREQEQTNSHRASECTDK